MADKLGESSADGVVEAVEPQDQADPRGGNPTGNWPSATNSGNGESSQGSGAFMDAQPGRDVEWDLRKPLPPYA